MKQVRILFLFLFFSIAYNSYGVVFESVYIKCDSITTVDAVKLPYYTFSPTDTFVQQNYRIEIMVGDTLDLWVHNTDSIDHYFDIQGATGVRDTIPSNDSIHVVYQFTSPGVFIYYDPLDFPNFSYMGLSGMLVVKDHNHASFYWNTKEHDSTFNYTLASGGNVVWNQYNPKYFTINGISHPNIINNPVINISGNVGDTLILYVSNTGYGMRSIHFHGYHGEIMFSSSKPTTVGRMKDTFPIYPMEAVMIQIVPDKPGIYPVHEHNLVAVTGNNFYPNGMFTLMNIQP